jgi:ubiquinone/menaquinone biosynthesis C-methylase UbiE
MAEQAYVSAHPDYLIDSPEEMRRLERQAAIYGTEDDLAALSLRPRDRVLDAGCGAGVIARTIARAIPQGSVTGLDREARYVEHARRRAAAEGLGNAEFLTGDVLELPFENDRFDIVWSKHLLQWVGRREKALEEFVRVARPGGRVIAANFDGFLLQHYPLDAEVQRMTAQWFDAARDQLGFDNFVGRKLPVMLRDAGLVDVRVHTMPDRAFSGLGGDPERSLNQRTQMESVFGFSAKVFGSEDAAKDWNERFMRKFDDPNTYWHCTMFYVQGTKPARPT